MPMEASMNVGIRPIERPQAPSAGDGVGRRGDGGGSSAAFSPKTNVAIQNAVDDMAGILAKIASSQTDVVEKMPADLQKLIQNVMKQAFSLEETLAQGLGSTVESQRFSMEQLSAFSRMLTQMGKLMERGMTMEVSDTMQVLLTNLKNMASTEQGSALEPVLLTKAAFELLDNKPFAELPKEVQQLLLTMQPQGMVQPLQAGEGNSLTFLKQLVQYFMPRPASGGEGGNAVQGQPAQMLQGQQAMPGQQLVQTPMQGQPVPQGQASAQPQTMGQPQGAQPNLTGQPMMEGNQQAVPGGNQTSPNMASQNLTNQNMTGQVVTGNPAGAGNMQAQAPGQSGAAVPQMAQTGTGQQIAGQPLVEGNQQAVPGVNQTGQNMTSQNLTSQNMTGQVVTGNPAGAGNMQAQVPGQSGAAMPQLVQTGTGQQIAGQPVMEGNQQAVFGANQSGQNMANQNMTNQNMIGQAVTGNPAGAGNMQAQAPGQSGAAVPQMAQAGTGQQIAGQPMMEGNQQAVPGVNQTGQNMTSQNLTSQNMTGQVVTGNPAGAGNIQAQVPGQSGVAMPQMAQTGTGQQIAGQSMMEGNQQAVPGANQRGQNMTNQNMTSQNLTSQNMTGQAVTGNPAGAGNMQDMRHAAQLSPQGMALGQAESAEQQARPQQAAMQQAKNQLMNQVLENTPQTMDALRDLAQLLIKDGNLTQKDALLMKSFVNGKEALLSAKEAQQLQQLIRLCQANVPATIQQAALQQNLPDLPRLWAFMQLCDMAYTRNMTSRQLKKAGKDVAAFVLSMRNSMEGDNSIVPGQRSLNFMMPMYMGEESTYPAYIHVYDEKQPDPETGEIKKETWLRLCVLTDNIGAVELTCRVYKENQLDMRLFFSSTETANAFRSEVDALRSSLKDSKLRLKELKIGAVGERRFM